MYILVKGYEQINVTNYSVRLVLTVYTLLEIGIEK